MTREEALQKFNAKARCMHTQRVAHRYWRYLQIYITDEQRRDLSIAWGHHVDVGEGPEELDDVCKRILTEWET